MSKILSTRRRFITVKDYEYDVVTQKNPLYSAQAHEHYMRHGAHYPIDEYLFKRVPRNITKKRHHIEYKIKCAHCGSANWVRRRDAIYCTPGCRKLAYLKKQKENKHQEEE